MKEITRIHIAKTPYDIELAAKKSLAAYMKALEAYSEDAEIIEDVELRITEILAERGIQKGGVITEADVRALKEQLGDPSEFMGEGDMAVGPETTGDGSRKLFRDTDHALLGGVLSGIAAFFKINPLWVRLLFIILALASFGTMLLVYAVLWIAVPPARTATDKLQMAGRPVTVRAIRELNENDVPASAARSDLRQALFILLGVGCVFGALGAAGVTVAALLGGLLLNHGAFSGVGGGYLLGAFVLALVSGLLLTGLFTLGAYAAFARKLTRRIIVSACVVVAVGLMSFGTAAVLAHYGSMREVREAQKNTHEISVPLPKDMRAATSLVADTPGLTVEYVAIDGKETPRAQATLLEKGDGKRLVVTTALKDGVLTVKTNKPAGDPCKRMRCAPWSQKVTVYGPALANIAAREDATLRYHGKTQPALAIDAARGAHVSVESGVIKTLTMTVRDASVSASEASVSRVAVRSMGAESITLGSIQSLQLTDNDTCPSGSRTRLNVWNVADGKIMVNGKTHPAESERFACTRLHVNSREES